MKTITKLKKEIEKLEKYMQEHPFYESCLDNKLDILKAKLQTLQNVCEEIEEIMNPLKLFDEDIVHEDRNWWNRYKQLLKKFQGDEK